MAKHLVKCAICGETFDTNLIQAVKHGARRYSHATCEPENKDFVPIEAQEQDEDMIKLKDYISKKYGDKAKWVLINKQIKSYVKDKGYSLSGILKSLVYFYDIKGNSIEGSNGGIGIVDYCYQDAFNYYYSLFIAQQANENKIFSNQEKEIIIKVPSMRGSKQKLIDFREWEEDEQ